MHKNQIHTSKFKVTEDKCQNGVFLCPIRNFATKKYRIENNIKKLFKQPSKYMYGGTLWMCSPYFNIIFCIFDIIGNINLIGEFSMAV